MSFIDPVTSNTVWTEHEITAHTEAMVRRHYSAEAETIINRAAVGAALGQYQPNETELEAINDLGSVTLGARQAGAEAKAANERLRLALEYEAAVARRELPPYEGLATLETEDGEVPHPDALRDQEERQAAEGVVANASAETLALVSERWLYRNPPEPEPINEELSV